MTRCAALLLLLLPLAATPAGAQGWRAWDQLSPEEQRRAWDNFQRYQQLPEQRQRMIERRYQQFQTLPPQEQQRLRQNYEAYRGLDPGARREFTADKAGVFPISCQLHPAHVAGQLVVVP